MGHLLPISISALGGDVLSASLERKADQPPLLWTKPGQSRCEPGRAAPRTQTTPNKKLERIRISQCGFLYINGLRLPSSLVFVQRTADLASRERPLGYPNVLACYVPSVSRPLPIAATFSNRPLKCSPPLESNRRNIPVLVSMRG